MDIRDCSLKYLAASNKTEKEMEKHLVEKGFASSAIKAEINFLKEFHYLDDAGYCLRYLEKALQKGRGIGRIKGELREKGIQGEMFDDAVFSYGIDDTKNLDKKRAAEQAEKLAGTAEITEKVLGKVGRKLTAQGYDSDAIYHAIGILMKRQKQGEYEWER